MSNNDRCIINFESAFNMLNNELAKINETLILICADGFVMQTNGIRVTLDIDAFYKSNAAIDNAIRIVGDVFGINKPDEFWLNNSISNMNPEPPGKYCEVIYSFTNLSVKAVVMDYLIGMKLVSARGQDLRDLAEIFKIRADINPLALMKILGDMGFEVDISILLDAFESARGMNWLDTFYLENEKELRKYF